MIDKPSDYFRLVFILHPRTRGKKIAILLPKKNLAKNSIEYLRAKTTIEIFNLDIRYLKFLNSPEIKRHSELLEDNAQTESRLENCLHFYTILRKLANKKMSLNTESFLNYWKNLKNQQGTITTLGLAQLIFKGGDNFTNFE